MSIIFGSIYSGTLFASIANFRTKSSLDSYRPVFHNRKEKVIVAYCLSNSVQLAAWFGVKSRSTSALCYIIPFLFK